MSDFYTLEQSNQDSQPVELFEFHRGSDSWYYTNFPTSIATNGHTWQPRAISRTTATMANTVPKDTIEVKLPYDDAMVAPLCSGAVFSVTSVTVWRSHVDGVDAIALWKGSVAKTARNQTVASLTCEPVFSKLQRQGITQPYQRTCRHIFGGKGCFVNRELYKTTYPTGVISRALVQLIIVGTVPNFIGGELKSADGQSQTVIGQTGSTVELMRPISTIVPGANVDMYLGCDRSLATCDATFGNAGNSGSQPGIPRINPWTLVRSVF